MNALPASVIWAYALLYLFIFIFGSVVGSFLNVVIYRLPRRISFVKGRSYCPACGRQLGAAELVPLFSFAFLGGKCRSCRAKISRRYPLVELLGGAAALLSFLSQGASLNALATFILLATLIAVAFIDWDTQEIPNGLVAFLLLPALLLIICTPQTDFASHLIGLFAVALPLFILTLFIPDSFGGGDIKLIAVCGLALGWQSVLLATFVALVTGGAYGVYLLKSKKADRKSHFAFGPFLALGVSVAALYGPPLITWYLSLFF